jgi:hypothetical protein
VNRDLRPRHSGFAVSRPSRPPAAGGTGGSAIRPTARRVPSSRRRCAAGGACGSAIRPRRRSRSRRAPFPPPPRPPPRPRPPPVACPRAPPAAHARVALRPRARRPRASPAGRLPTARHPPAARRPPPCPRPPPTRAGRGARAPSSRRRCAAGGACGSAIRPAASCVPSSRRRCAAGGACGSAIRPRRRSPRYRAPFPPPPRPPPRPRPPPVACPRAPPAAHARRSRCPCAVIAEALCCGWRLRLRNRASPPVASPPRAIPPRRPPPAAPPTPAAHARRPRCPCAVIAEALCRGWRLRLRNPAPPSVAPPAIKHALAPSGPLWHLRASEQEV